MPNLEQSSTFPELTAISPEPLDRYTKLVEKSYDAGPSRAAFEDIFEQARATVVEPHEQELFDTAVSIYSWNLWGKPGDPLPHGLRINQNEEGRNTLAYAFPFGAKQDADALEALYGARFGYAGHELAGLRYKSADTLEPALREAEYRAPSVAFLRNIVATEPATAQVHDSFAEQVRSGQARHQVSRETGVDIFATKHDPAALGSDRYTSARQKYMRLTEFADPPQKNTAVQTPSLEKTRDKLIEWLTSVDENAPAVVAAAHDGYALPDYLNNPQSHEANKELSLLLTKAQRTIDGPFPFPQNMDLFESVTNSLLTRGKSKSYHNGGLGWDDISQHFKSWDEYINQRAEKYLTGVINEDELLSGMHSRNEIIPQLLLALKAPEVVGEQEEPLLVTKPLGDPEDVQLRMETYSPLIDSETITFLPQDYSETQAERPIGMIIECRRPTWPQVRRLIEGRTLHEASPQLPTSSDDADIALFIQQKNFVGANEVPKIAGFNLVAADHDLQRYYFAYDKKYDPYAHDEVLEPSMIEKISEAAEMIGMSGLSTAIKTEDDLSYRGLSTLVQRFAFHGYPGKDIVQGDQALVARARNLDDLKKFVNKEGIFCGQCSGGARLFQLLVDTGKDWQTTTQARIGHVWEGLSEMVMAIGHQQTSVFSGHMLIDTSLSPREDIDSFPLKKASTPGQGIHLGTSEAALGLEDSDSSALSISFEGPTTSNRLSQPQAPTNTQQPKSQEKIITRQTPNHKEVQAPDELDVIENHQPVSIAQKARAALARKRLERISSNDAHLALELGRQALFAPDISITKAEETIEHSKKRKTDRQDMSHDSDSNGLEVLKNALGSRYQKRKQYEQEYYSEKTQSRLNQAAQHASPAELAQLQRAAYIMRLVMTADKDPLNF